MASRVVLPSSLAMVRRLEGLRGLPRSRKYAGFRRRVQTVVLNGHRDGVLAGTDGRGRPLAPLAASTLANRKRGPGPPLAPHGAASRVIRLFRAEWREEGGVFVLVRYWDGFDSKKGYPIMVAQLKGTRTIPARPVGGIRPQTWAQIGRMHRDFMDEITRP